MSTLALDIGTYSIKAIAGKAGSKPKIERIAEVFNTTGIAVPTDDVNQDKLVNLIESIIIDNSRLFNSIIKISGVIVVNIFANAKEFIYLYR